MASESFGGPGLALLLVRTFIIQLQQHQLALRARLERAYADRLSRRISDELRTSKSGELEAERSVSRTDMARHG